MIGTNENGFYMPVAPAMIGYGNGNNGGFGNGDWGSWILLLLIFGLFGGWGNGNGWGGGFGGNNQLSYDFPWILNGQNSINANTNNGFRDAMINDGINGIQNSITAGFGNLNTNLCSNFGTVNANISNAQNAIANQLYTNQISDLERSFASQTAISQGLNNISSQFAQCCCDNKLMNAMTQNIVQNEGNATRYSDANNTRDIIDSQTRGTQAILDKLCALELDGVKAQVEAKNDEIARLRQDLTMKDLAASQTAQTASIRAGQVAEIDAMYQRLKDCPVNTVPVFGSQPIFTCPNNYYNNNGCGCGM